MAWPIDMRNRLIHGYFDIQPDRIWEAIDRDLPLLEAKVRALLDETTE